MKISYIVASTVHGTLIVNRNDENQSEQYGTYGVGFNLLETGGFYKSDIDLLVSVLRLKKRQLKGKRKIVAIDCGANIGVHTIELARELSETGSVVAIEAQKAIYYALCGNIAINNCFNVDARNVAVGAEDGVLKVPHVDYQKKSSFGSLELRKADSHEDIGQAPDYDRGYDVPLVRIDSLRQDHVDLVKIDVEGMEQEVIKGAIRTLESSRPVLFIEKIKSDFAQIESSLLSLGYEVLDVGPNVLAVHEADADLAGIRELVANPPR
ncbi:FkbM family methyltransferase [Burkholderia gladioli]|uniref:FkbM family methyltransferase n=1 Tax=Burkholderia gladioli TaxID=28095 RepID=UPI00163E1ECC|nr:FkbM family methyltransferase [Burkholderia gladioli]MBJ9661429.1 FkbM family methyltransferase [Burkholderia gladioli]